MQSVTFLITVMTVQLPAALTKSPPYLPPPDPITTCAAATCSVQDVCRLVYDPTTGRIGPRCINPNDLPRDAENRDRCTFEAPLLQEDRRGRHTLYRCDDKCPSPTLVCTKDVCCVANTTTPSPPPKPVCNRLCDPGFKCFLVPSPCPPERVCTLLPICLPDNTPPTKAPPLPPDQLCNEVCKPGFKCVLTNPPCPPGLACPLVVREVPTCVPDTTLPFVKPGQCPTLPIGGAPRPCVERCFGDESCPGDRKCCFNGCGTECAAPVQKITCANIDCFPDYTCIETPAGPECVPVKPGTCPSLPFACPKNSFCRDECTSDRDCPGGEKCCPQCGCRQCQRPFPTESCKTKKCPTRTRCVEELFSVRCEPIEKPGECPQFKCPAPPAVPICLDSCIYDSDCKGWDKCCLHCSGCRQCLPSSQPLSCSTVTCITGTRCVEGPGGARCEPITVDNPCSLPAESGPCFGYFPRYFYNPVTRRCSRFIYGGCQGNANNFETVFQCFRACAIRH